MRILLKGAVLVTTSLTILASCSAGQFGLSRSPYSASTNRLSALSQQLRSNPNNVKTLTEIGHEHARLSQWEQSLGAYREALIVDGSNGTAKMGYSRALLAVGQYESGHQQVDQILAASKTDVAALILKSGALTGQKRYQEAQQVLISAQQIAPRDLDVRSNLALVKALAGDPSAYAEGRAAAFAPDADIRHQRNLILVGGISGQSNLATQDGRMLGLEPDTVKKLISLGNRAKSVGMGAFGLAPVA